jgi:hypothetical protein
MTDHLHLWPGIQWSKKMREAEEMARAIMSLSDKRKPLGLFSRDEDTKEALYMWWVEVFGTSEEELDELGDAIVRQYRRTLPFFVRKRHRLMTQWVRLSGMKTAAHGLTTIWS